MPTPPFHEELRVLSVQVLSRHRSSGPPRLEICAMSSKFEDLNALAVAVELIEMRYQEHCARVKVEELFANGELGCL
jgi:hypothetical protein